MTNYYSIGFQGGGKNGAKKVVDSTMQGVQTLLEREVAQPNYLTSAFDSLKQLFRRGEISNQKFAQAMSDLEKRNAEIRAYIDLCKDSYRMSPEQFEIKRMNLFNKISN